MHIAVVLLSKYKKVLERFFSGIRAKIIRELCNF